MKKLITALFCLLLCLTSFMSIAAEGHEDSGEITPASS